MKEDRIISKTKEKIEKECTGMSRKKFQWLSKPEKLHTSMTVTKSIWKNLGRDGVSAQGSQPPVETGRVCHGTCTWGIHQMGSLCLHILFAVDLLGR